MGNLRRLRMMTGCEGGISDMFRICIRGKIDVFEIALEETQREVGTQSCLVIQAMTDLSDMNVEPVHSVRIVGRETILS